MLTTTEADEYSGISNPVPFIGAIYHIVDKPFHYNTGKIECIDAIRASMSSIEFRGHLKATVEKYIWRYNYKGKPLQDLEKAQWYLNKLIEEVKNDKESIA